MSNIAHATLFRLGYSIKWQATYVAKDKLYKNYLQINLVIYRFINNFFKVYTTPIFTPGRNRASRMGTGSSNKTSGLDNLIFNPFIENTFVFSHLAISRANRLEISCYFLDTLLDEWRLSFLHSIRNSSSTFFRPKRYPYKKLTSLTDLSYFPKFYRQTYKFKKIKKKLSRRSITQINRFFRKRRKGLKTYLRLKPLKKQIRAIIAKERSHQPFNKRYAIFNERTFDAMNKYLRILRFYPLFLYDNEFENDHIEIRSRFKMLKICLILFKQKIACWKQQQFYIIILKNLLLSVFKCPRFVPPFAMFKLLNSIIIREFSFKHLNFYFFKEIFFGRFILFQGAGSAIYSSLKEFDKNENIFINFFGMHTRNISASFITNFIIIKLGQYFTIHQILGPFLRKLRNTGYIKGFRIIVAGRLTRKERAAYIVRTAGDITLGTKSCYIDYAADFKIMRFGVVGVKVWFYLKGIRPYYYVFKYRYRKKI